MKRVRTPRYLHSFLPSLLLLSLGGVLFISFLLGSTILLFTPAGQTGREGWASLDAKGKGYASLLAQMLPHFLSPVAPERIESLLTAVAQDPAVVYIYLLDSRGKVLARRLGTHNPLIQQAGLPPVPQNYDAIIKQLATSSQEVLVASAGVTVQGKAGGKVEVGLFPSGASLRSRSATFLPWLFLLATGGGTLLFLALLFTYWRQVVHPFRLLIPSPSSSLPSWLRPLGPVRLGEEIPALMKGYREMQETQEQLVSFLSLLNRFFSRSRELKEMLQEVPRVVENVLGDRCTLFLLNSEGNGLIPLSTGASAGQPPLPSPLPLSRSAVGKAVLSQEPILIADTSSAETYPDTQGVSSYLAVPLFSGGQMWGGLALAALRRERRFTEQDIWMATVLADRIAVGIEKAKLSYEFRMAEARYRSVLEGTEEAVIACNTEGIIQGWNPAAERMFGYRAEEIVGQPFAVLTPPEHRPVMEAWQEGVLSGEEISPQETQRLRKDGTVVPVRMTLIPLRDQGEITGFFSLEQDITAYRHLEEAVSAEQVLATTLIEGVSDGIMLLDAGGRARVYNRRMEEITGYAREEVNRQGWHHLGELVSSRQEGEEREEEWIIRDQEGRERSLRGRILSVKDPNGEQLTLWIVQRTGQDGEEGAEAERGRKEKTILLVDDDPTIRELGRDILSLKGYPVMTAENGMEALQLYQEHGEEIALVILDMVMPKMSGRETFHALRRLNPAVKIILSSGYSQEHELRDLLEQGVETFIPKPYNVQKFLGVVDAILSGKE
ncbi:MAG: PAS domain S-box protein [Nitrospinota bacterium]|nr:MAG: PAS domain S-box protein [Nitrospinota bacterium]